MVSVSADPIQQPRAHISREADTSTAGFVLIMSYSCRSILQQVDPRTVDEGWRKCEDVLTNMSTFSVSARHSLQFLQVTHQHIVQNCSGEWRVCSICPVRELTYKAASWAEEHQSLAPGHLQKGNRHFGRSEIPSQPSEMLPDDPAARGEAGGPSFNTYMSWDEMGLGQDEFGFLGRFDLPDLANWFTDVPDIS